MKKHTSASVNFEVALEICYLSKKANISISKVLQQMIIIFLKKSKAIPVNNILTEYQKKSHNGYEIMHYCVDDNLINDIGYFRWLHKFSVSKMVFVTFLLFWEDVCVHFLGEEERVELRRDFLTNYELFKTNNMYQLAYFLRRFVLDYKIPLLTG